MLAPKSHLDLQCFTSIWRENFSRKQCCLHFYSNSISSLRLPAGSKNNCLFSQKNYPDSREKNALKHFCVIYNGKASPGAIGHREHSRRCPNGLEPPQGSWWALQERRMQGISSSHRAGRAGVQPLLAAIGAYGNGTHWSLRSCLVTSCRHLHYLNTLQNPPSPSLRYPHTPSSKGPPHHSNSQSRQESMFFLPCTTPWRSREWQHPLAAAVLPACSWAWLSAFPPYSQPCPSTAASPANYWGRLHDFSSALLLYLTASPPSTCLYDIYSHVLNLASASKHTLTLSFSPLCPMAFLVTEHCYLSPVSAVLFTFCLFAHRHAVANFLMRSPQHTQFCWLRSRIQRYPIS